MARVRANLLELDSQLAEQNANAAGWMWRLAGMRFSGFRPSDRMKILPWSCWRPVACTFTLAISMTFPATVIWS